MSLIARFHRWRARETKFWLPFEQQLHQLLVSDAHLAQLRNVLMDQIATLYTASRSQDIAELSATYTYRCSLFFDVTEEFTLCEVRASNATGTIEFGGGLLASIRLRPTATVTNPATFLLQNPTLINVQIPSLPDQPEVSGWIAELENDGVLRRFGAPRARAAPTYLQPSYWQYRELFDHCAEAALLLNSELFYFLHPADTKAVKDERLGLWLPVLDLRELGGLAITNSDNDESAISMMVDGSITWSEADLGLAIRRAHAELGK